MVASNPSSSIPVWYQTYQQHLSTMACRLGYGKEEVEDLLSSFFLDLLEKNIDWTTVTHPQAYLSTAFRRKLIDYNRNPRRRMFVVTSELPEQPLELSAASPLEQVQNSRELVEQIKRAYSQLPERCRKVIYLKFYKGLTTAQIAAQLGLSKRSVYNNLFEGIRLLRTEMGRSSPGISYAALMSLLPILLVP